MKNIEGIEKHQFQKGTSGNPKGRPKGSSRSTFKVFRDNCKAKGIKVVSKSEYIEAMGCIFNLLESEINDLINDASQPLALRMIAKDFTDKKIGAKMRADYRDYLFGKAKIEVETTAVTPPKDYSNLTDDELILMTELEDKINGIERD